MGHKAKRCGPCSTKHVACEGVIPCHHCLRLGLHCTPHPSYQERIPRASSSTLLIFFLTTFL
ncbi:hypothetical protein QBC38DRAFT_493647 [Podospora fimiseda]|uniref:Zn(2)-C6 fungal-type domain-containing protein n=1 Tax=Podospora fimiseda TaxID=252190 RepID=A0AAN6YMG8_9PEZI|nr:hypothetical protein QBC38DRAFT_493647 [Podospora fimiseda]